MNYCKLYIDTELGQAELENEVADGFHGCVQMDGVEYTVFPNDLYQGADPLFLIDPVARSRFYVEIDSGPEIPDGDDEFNAAIANLIIWLRQRCGYVVASCAFEDYVTEVTGWNWAPQSPLPDQ